MNNDDTISREAAIKALRQWGVAISTERAAAEIEHLPSVQTQVVQGRWEFPVFTDNEDGLDPRVKCSVCGGVEAAFARWKYCPNCGAKMDGGEDDGK